MLCEGKLSRFRPVAKGAAVSLKLGILLTCKRCRPAFLKLIAMA